jgi:hypothetical protein
MDNVDGISDALLTAPDTQLDGSMKPLIEKWSNPPTSLQVLEVLDKCIHGSLGSGFVVQVLQMAYDHCLKTEGKTHEQNVPLATWRQELE